MEYALPDFNAVNQALIDLESLGDAAETHGLLCAMLSSGVIVRREAWIDSVISRPISPGDGKAAAAYKVLSDLYNQTETALTEMDDFDLRLLLPDDEDAFSIRIAALVHWSQGFVSGLGTLGIDIQKEQGDVAEAINDLTRIACLAYEDEVGDEAGETAYTELVEYTRLAVVLLHDELRNRFGKNTRIMGDKTLH